MSVDNGICNVKASNLSLNCICNFACVCLIDSHDQSSGLPECLFVSRADFWPNVGYLSNGQAYGTVVVCPSVRRHP